MFSIIDCRESAQFPCDHPSGYHNDGSNLMPNGTPCRCGALAAGGDCQLISHNTQMMQGVINARLAEMEKLEADDIAEAVAYVVTRPRRVAINEMLIRPTEQDA